MNEPSQTASAALDFALRMARAQTAMLRRLDGALGSHHGLSFSDFMLLFYLNRAPGGRLRRVDLAERQGLTASGVTRTLLPLEKIGLVDRQQDPRDARVGYAVISPAGQQLLAHAIVTAQQVSEELLRHAPAEQLDALTAVLGQIAGTSNT